MGSLDDGFGSRNDSDAMAVNMCFTFVKGISAMKIRARIPWNHQAYRRSASPVPADMDETWNR